MCQPTLQCLLCTVVQAASGWREPQNSIKMYPDSAKIVANWLDPIYTLWYGLFWKFFGSQPGYFEFLLLWWDAPSSSSMLVDSRYLHPGASTIFIWPHSKAQWKIFNSLDPFQWEGFTASKSVQCIHLKGLQLSQGQEDLIRAASKSHPLERSWRPAERAHLNFDMAMLGNPRNQLITFWHEFEIHLSLSH